MIAEKHIGSLVCIFIGHTHFFGVVAEEDEFETILHGYSEIKNQGGKAYFEANGIEIRVRTESIQAYSVPSNIKIV